jgi:pre-rRNA-processing protein TSR3
MLQLKQNAPPTIVLRHRKENLKKCSLRGLEQRPDFRFYTYPMDELPSLEGYMLLTVDAPPLTEEDAHYGLFVIDATWRYAEVMLRQFPPEVMPLRRSLPRQYRTAYPRRQDHCPQAAEYGLASIEAIYLARQLLGMDTTGLLDNYHWRDQFLSSLDLS